ncbi:MAG: pilus assembly protein PilM, partial [Candidatus Hydrogenedens sp.]
METKGNKYIFLTIEGEHYTLLRVQKTRKAWEVLNYETSFEPDHPAGDAFSQLIKRARENRWTNEPCYLVLPRHEITSRIVTLPSQDIEEIKNMVSLSAEEFVPYSLEEIQISQCILEKLPDFQSRVFVAIAHRDLIQEKIKILQKAGWEPLGILVSTGLLINSAPEILKKSSQIHVLFVHLTIAGIEVAIFDKHTLHFSRGVRMGWESGETTNPIT